MKAGVLLVFLMLTVASALVGWRVVDERDAEITYYKLALSEIGHDMAINYKLHNNALKALRSCK